MKNISDITAPKLTKMLPSKIGGFNPLFSSISNEQFEDLPDSIFTDSIKGAVQTILSSILDISTYFLKLFKIL